ncbi:MAG: N,N-dimethylformamidase beta subunit family domain-containing protein [Ilumatobacteraceae bacterium]
MSDDFTGYDAVEGYCGQLSYVAGDTLTLHVSCTTPTFDVQIHRWGATRDHVWQRREVIAQPVTTPADADANGCAWPAAIELAVPHDWTSGFYDVSLSAPGALSDRAVSHACFVVRAAQPTSSRLLVVATNTYNAYNAWGGRSLYTGGKQVSFRRPFGRGMISRETTQRDDRKARPTHRGEEPDVEGDIYQRYRFRHGLPGYMASAGWFTYERRFVEWAESNGLPLDYAISADLEDHADVVDGYDLVLGVGHDEYWSATARTTVEAFVRAGGTYASMSGNTMFWQVRLEDGGDTMVCHKYSAHDTDPVVQAGRPEAMTGMWCDPVAGRPESAFLGASSAYGLYSRFGMATPRGSGAFTVYRHDHWLLRGTGLRYGDLLGASDGVVGYETVGCRLGFDELQLPVAVGGDNTPTDIEVVAFTPSSNLAKGEYPASIAALEDQGDLEFIAARLYGGVDEESMARVRYGNAVMVVSRPFGDTGGEVVTVGSTDWVFGLADDPAVAQVTRNILERTDVAG